MMRPAVVKLQVCKACAGSGVRRVPVAGKLEWEECSRCAGTGAQKRHEPGIGKPITKQAT